MNESNDMAILNGETDPANDGTVAPLDGSHTSLTVGASQNSLASVGGAAGSGALGGKVPLGIDGKRAAASAQEAIAKVALGANNERLEELRPDLVNALRELVVEYREEGMVARRHEIRRIRQARLFWQGLQYAWWNPKEMTWNLPYESKLYDDSAAAEMPRYQFVTNIYQAFGLSFISILSQDVPATRFYPQSAQSIGDITAARAASQVCDLVEQNNRVQNLLTGVAFYLWTDGKIGGYVRYVADAQRFGSHDEPVIEEHYVALGDDAYVCPECGAEQGVGGTEAGDADDPDGLGTNPTLRRNGEGWGTRAENLKSQISNLKFKNQEPESPEIGQMAPGANYDSQITNHESRTLVAALHQSLVTSHRSPRACCRL